MIYLPLHQIRLPNIRLPDLTRWGYYAVCMIWALATGCLIYVELNFLMAFWWRWSAIMVLSWWLPGFLLIWRWQPPGLDRPTAAILALGLGWCWQIALLIGMHWIPGPLSYPLFLSLYAGGALVLLFLCRGRTLSFQPLTTRTLTWLFFLLVIAATLRLPGLGYHEFHQDETHLLRRANDAIRGGDDALARHTKGIGEIAAVMVTYRALGTETESAARLPFALTSVVSVLALAILGRRLFADDRIGAMAGLLFALNGFVLGLSRIAQYQAVVLLLSILAFLAMWEFYRTHSRSWLVLAVVFSAFGLVMHYEYLLNFLPLLLLLIAGLRRAEEHAPHQRHLLNRTLLWSGLTAILIITVTYLPLLLNPYFATTKAYLDTRLTDGRVNNFAFFIEMGTFYNSIYFAVGFTFLVAIGIFVGLQGDGWRRLKGWMSLDWTKQRERTTLLIAWFLPAAILYLLIVQYPGTHFYFFMPSWSLLAAPILVFMLFTTGKPRLWIVQWSARCGVFLWLAVSITYLAILFFRQSPAYLVNYPQTQLALYWAPYGEQIPQEPRFGFPIHQGWKALGILGEWGYIGERYASNERSDALRWYLRSYDRVALSEEPEYVFVAHHLQELDPDFDDDLLEQRYQQIGEVRADGKVQITIWAKHAPAAGYLRYDAELFTQAFDQDVPALRTWMAASTQVVNETLDDTLTLRDATHNRAQFAPGDLLHLVLWWDIEREVQRDYKLFVHVADEMGHPLAQWDGMPGQNTQQTTTWQTGMQFEEHVLIRLPTDLPVGEYSILVGFYDPVTGNRLGDHAIETMTLEIHT